jgi:hypothetical protein
VFEIIGRKTVAKSVRFAVMLPSILFRSFLRDVSVRLMDATFDLYLSRKIKLPPAGRASLRERDFPDPHPQVSW